MDKPDIYHPDYAKIVPKWARCRDAFEGQDAIHAGGETYLPKLSEQSQREYDAYKMRTPWFNAAGRTLDALVGMVFRKAPSINGMDEITADVTLSGHGMAEFAQMLTREVLGMGRVGCLVEFPRSREDITTAAQASAANLRPYASIYTAQSIINWRCERVNNVMQPVMVVLSETHETPGVFGGNSTPQIRVLRLVQGAYIQEIWQKPKEEWVLVETVTPLMRGAPLPYIPFVIFGAKSNTFTTANPPLVDLVDINLSHYRTTADLEHGAHFTGLPTPFIAGIQLGDNERIVIGSATAITTPDPSARASYLEFTGAGLSALEGLLTRKEAQMAAIGARMLAPEKASVESGAALSIRNAGETSVLAGQAKLVQQGIQRVLDIIAEWGGIAPAEYTINTDFLPATMTAQELTALVQAWQSGAISQDTLFYNLKQGELIEEGRTLEDEQGAIGQAEPLGAIPAADTEAEPGLLSRLRTRLGV